jgi:uncharacterized membrane protein
MTPLESWTAVAAFITIVVALLWLHADWRRWEDRREARRAFSESVRVESRNLRVIGGRDE